MAALSPSDSGGQHAPARVRVHRTLRTLPAPWTATVRSRLLESGPVAAAPAEVAGMARYIATGPWCAGYALRTRRAAVVWLMVVAVPTAAAAYRLAYLLHGLIDARALWTSGTAGPAEGRVQRWLATHHRRPPALADVADVAGERGTHPALTAAVLAVTAVCYAAAWLAARPGRAAAALFLLLIFVIFL